MSVYIGIECSHLLQPDHIAELGRIDREIAACMMGCYGEAELWRYALGLVDWNLARADLVCRIVQSWAPE